jgi:hypothetical protein
MTTQDDITIVNDDDEMQFQCRVCSTRFKTVPRSVANRQREERTLDHAVRKIVAEHIRACAASPSHNPKKK